MLKMRCSGKIENVKFHIVILVFYCSVFVAMVDSVYFYKSRKDEINFAEKKS